MKPFAFFLAIALLALAPVADAQQTPASQSRPQYHGDYFPNTVLHDQDGRAVRFYDDLIRGKVVAINFVYTTCTTVCPIASAIFAEMQRKLGTAPGRDVVLVTITVDPLRDTPERLREYAARYGAGEGWVHLTGAKRDVDNVLKGFGAYTPNFEDHPAMVLVGEAGGANWTRFIGFPSVDQLLARVGELRAARGKGGRTAQHAGH